MGAARRLATCMARRKRRAVDALLRPVEHRPRQAASRAPRFSDGGAITMVNRDRGATDVTRDTDYFRRRAAEARAAAFSKDESHNAEIAGELALAYAALARRRATT